MRARVIEVFNSCSNDIKSNFQNVLVEVKRWVKSLKSSSDDTSFQKYITGKFRSHMEFGQHQEPIQDIDDIGDRILQWGYQRDRLRAEVKQNFPSNHNTSVQTISSVPTTSHRTSTNSKTSRLPATKTPKVVDMTQLLRMW